MANELAKVQDTQIAPMSPSIWDMYLQQAKAIAASGMISGITRQEQAVVVMLMGYDLGVSPTAAARGIDVIQGKPAIKPQFMAGLVQRAGHPRIRTIERTDKQCTLEFRHRDDEQVVTVTYSWDEANKAGLTGKDNYKKNPADMLYNRCLGRGVRQEYPEIFFNLYTPDEVRDMDVVETTARPVTPAEPTPLHPELKKVSPEISERFRIGNIIAEDTGTETILDDSSWRPITKGQAEAALLKLVNSSDFKTVAQGMGITSFSDEVKKVYPDAKGAKAGEPAQQYSALLHLVYNWRETGKDTEVNKAHAAQAEAIFEEGQTRPLEPEPEDEDF